MRLDFILLWLCRDFKLIPYFIPPLGSASLSQTTYILYGIHSLILCFRFSSKWPNPPSINTELGFFGTWATIQSQIERIQCNPIKSYIYQRNSDYEHPSIGKAIVSLPLHRDTYCSLLKNSSYTKEFVHVLHVQNLSHVKKVRDRRSAVN